MLVQRMHKSFSMVGSSGWRLRWVWGQGAGRTRLLYSTYIFPPPNRASGKRPYISLLYLSLTLFSYSSTKPEIFTLHESQRLSIKSQATVLHACIFTNCDWLRHVHVCNSPRCCVFRVRFFGLRNTNFAKFLYNNKSHKKYCCDKACTIAGINIFSDNASNFRRKK